MTKDIIALLREIDAGKVDLEKVDWTAYARELIAFSELFKTPSQGFGWLYGLFTLVGDFDVRRKCFGYLQGGLYELGDEIKHKQRLEDDLGCMELIAFELNKHKYIIPNGDPKEFYICFVWRQLGNGALEGRQHRTLDELLYYYNCCGENAHKLISFSQQLYRTAESGAPDSIVDNLVYALRHEGDLETKSIVDFCKYLYLAKGHIGLLQQGIDNYNELPNYVEFDKELREECFNEYVSMRSMNGDHDDVYDHLYYEAKVGFNHEIELNTYKDQFVYDRTWRRGRQGVDDLLHHFMSYLERKMAGKAEGKPGTTIIINGNVANAIGKVEQLKTQQDE